MAIHKYFENVKQNAAKRDKRLINRNTAYF